MPYGTPETSLATVYTLSFKVGSNEEFFSEDALLFQLRGRVGTHTEAEVDEKVQEIVDALMAVDGVSISSAMKHVSSSYAEITPTP